LNLYYRSTVTRPISPIARYGTFVGTFAVANNIFLLISFFPRPFALTHLQRR
jgi:hypothetical protein